MEASSSNPLLSAQKSSQLQTVLHPLVILTISDYITRHTLRGQNIPIVGALLGQQNGREVTIEHAFDCHVREAPDVQGGYLLDDTKFSARLEQMVTVHKDRQLELVGWYTLLPPSGPTPTVLPIHTQILESWNESALLLGFHPQQVLEHTVGGKLPLTIYESNFEVDTDQDGEDKKMDDGERSLKLKFREAPYSVETDETEMISMNYIAEGGGNAAAVAAKEAAPSRTIETNDKGKRRLVENDGEEAAEGAEGRQGALSRDEDEMLSSLTAKANAVKMLQSRIDLLVAYLERLPPSFLNGEAQDASAMETDHTTPSPTVLRQIQALVSRLDLVIPSDSESFQKEMLAETNDVHMIDLLTSIIRGVDKARGVGSKFGVIDSATKLQHRRGHDAQASYSGLHGGGDLML